MVKLEVVAGLCLFYKKKIFYLLFNILKKLINRKDSIINIEITCQILFYYFISFKLLILRLNYFLRAILKTSTYIKFHCYLLD